MKKFKWLALVIVVVLSLSIVLAACNKKDEAPAETWGNWETVAAANCTKAGLEKRESSLGNVETRAIAATGHNFGANHICTVCGENELAMDNIGMYADLTYGTDYKSLYDLVGASVKISDVLQKNDGRAYIYLKDGKLASAATEGAQLTELGMDFLSMAMVYNTQPAGDFETAEDVYAEWWKLYIQRWNLLLPEVPLYSNEYYDVYNKKLGGVTEHPTNPYWGPAKALIDWTSSDDKIIIGNITDLSGKFRYSSFGASNPGAADNDVAGLVSGLATVTANKEGNYQVDDTVVDQFSQELNEDGTLTFTIKIKNDLKFSDGSAIKAKNYLVTALVFSTPVAAQAAGRDHKAGMSYVGYDEFAAYDGTNDGQDILDEDGEVVTTASKYFKGFRLLDEYTFSATVISDYAGYFYSLIQAGFGPEYLPLWLGEGVDILDSENGVYLSDAFYAKDGTSFAKAAHIKASAANTNTDYPYSGPYYVESYDAAQKMATLKKNNNYKGNYEGTKPSIGTVVYKKIVAKTQLADFDSNGVDVLAAITGGDETNEVISYAKGTDGQLGTADDKAILTHYSRAGYGKLGFRADFGPVQFMAVREAIALCLDRSDFASQFTGGYGGVVDGPYYTGAWMYQEVEDDIILNTYTKSVEAAKDLLAANGWIYNAVGSAYAGTGVRYKKIDADLMSDADKTFRAIDGSLTTVYDAAENCYYMPLVLNWFGTQDNPFTDLLVTEFKNGAAFAQAGFSIHETIGDFNPMLDELYQYPVHGYYDGTPKYTCFNFATGFNSAVYDYSYNWTINPAMYDDLSICYVKDYADFYLLAK